MVTNTGGKITLKLRVPSPSAQYTLVQGAAPVRTGVRCVQHFPFLGFLPPPTDGWSDITKLHIARYGVPKAGTAIWIRTCQHIDGWIDVPQSGSRPCPRRRPVAANPTMAEAYPGTTVLRIAKIRSPKLETRNKPKFPTAQCSKPALGRWF